MWQAWSTTRHEWARKLSPPSWILCFSCLIPGRYSHAARLQWRSNLAMSGSSFQRNACEPKLLKRTQDLATLAIHPESIWWTGDSLSSQWRTTCEDDFWEMSMARKLSWNIISVAYSESKWYVQWKLRQVFVPSFLPRAPFWMRAAICKIVSKYGASVEGSFDNVATASVDSAGAGGIWQHVPINLNRCVSLDLPSARA